MDLDSMLGLKKERCFRKELHYMKERYFSEK
jgi:hypothetical protein